ncbi:uncharacterized protein LOC117539872 [Gymnodraco acuticeps]|uniref:Uncharacterized protein LOC117539872 n=1 Tax=Gymnodraco acuticeps TaxID=8218 RepID=A0A6P8TE02_GYMAC|nr:uncharacterized protein LOC117539872 [Gymnodraco acuticeps]
MDKQAPKRKGGAQKLRDKKMKALEEGSAKSKKITDFSFGPAAGSSCSTTTTGEADVTLADTAAIPSGSESSNETDTAQRHLEPSTSSDMMAEDDPAADTDRVSQGQDVSATPVDYFTRPMSGTLDLFFRFHPQQKADKAVVQRAFFCKDGTNRKWLSYSEAREVLFCSLCMAFANPRDSNSFITGMTNFTHIHQRVEEHEQSHAHRGCAEAYFLRFSKNTIQDLLMGPQMSRHREEVRRKRQVLERIIDVLKLIGQRGLSYRGTQAEALYTLDDDTIDHGNFLEMIVLLGKYDVCLKEHLTLCIEKSKQIHQSGLRQGRGSLVTLLSKTTINYIITTIQRLMKATIATEVRESGMYSVQIDTTQDITAQDQCSVVIRYVTDIVHERLVAVIKCEASTGQYFAQLVVNEVLETMKLDVRQCIGDSTDGASNMQGQYKGFSALLAKMSPTHVHVWCYAHVLNLVLADTTQCVLASGSLFSLLNNIAVFIRVSYQRMNIWEKESKDPRHRRLAPIGETRWWSKDVAVTKVFGSFGKPDNALYVDVLHTLSAIQHGQTINATARVNAHGYITQLLRYETILTAQIFLRIFQVTSPVSKYLQKSGMDILTAHRMIVAAETQLKDMTRDFEKVKTAAATFVQWANNQTEEQSEETELEVEAALPQKRGRKKKTMPGEMSKDEAVTDAETSYKIDVHNQIMDTRQHSKN